MDDELYEERDMLVRQKKSPKDRKKFWNKPPKYWGLKEWSIIISILTGGGGVGANLDTIKAAILGPPLFSAEEKKIILDNAKNQKAFREKFTAIQQDLEKIIKDYNAAGLTIAELADHANDPDIHMRYREKVKEFVTNTIYQDFLKNYNQQHSDLNAKMDLLLAHAMDGN